MERSTLSEYPLQIMSSGMDLYLPCWTLPAFRRTAPRAPLQEEDMVPVRQMLAQQMVSGITTNDLKSLKQYLDHRHQLHRQCHRRGVCL